jgi:peptide-methionine (S)-S-oxide reductase
MSRTRPSRGSPRTDDGRSAGATAAAGGRLLAVALLAAALAASPARAQRVPVAVFAGGRFWGLEAAFEAAIGVTGVVSGYTGGTLHHPTWEAVRAGIGDHALAVRVSFDPTRISYAELIEIFMRAHDPTQRDGQGPDEGRPFRSAIFWADGYQEQVARRVLERLAETEAFRGPIATELVRLGDFWPAEPEHQDYAARNPEDPHVATYDLPRLAELRRRFERFYRR